jgi:hypothetical protein
MKAWLASILLKKAENKRYWIILSLIVKSITFLILLYSNILQPYHHGGFWGSLDGDSGSYVDPIDHFLSSGNYTPDLRMPGYGVIYLVPRLFFSQETSYNILIILQFLTSAISVYYLALLARILFKNAAIFYITFYIFLFSQFSNYYDGCIMSESFCTSFLIFASYSFAKYFDSGNSSCLFFSGILFTWIIFIKPIFVLILPVAFFILIIIEWKQKKQFYNKQIVLFILPFVLIDVAWIARNYSVHKTFQPLTSLAYHEYIEIMPAMDFVKSWGGTYHPWRRETAVCWFGFNIKKSPNYTVPDGDIPQALEGKLGHNYFYTSRFNYDSLLQLKKMVMLLRDSANNTIQTNNKLRSQISEKFSTYTASVRKEKPYLYYVKSRMKYLELLFMPDHNDERVSTALQNKNGSNLLYSGITWVYLKIISNLGMLLYPAILYGGLVGLFFVILYGIKNSVIVLLVVTPILNTLLPSVILNLDENRYIIPMWPFLIICASYLIMSISAYLNRTITYVRLR